MKSRDALWLAGAAALLVLAAPKPAADVPPRTAPKPTTKRPPAPAAKRQGDVISYFLDVPGSGLVVVKTAESPDVSWGTPELRADKVPALQAMMRDWGSQIDDVGVEFRIPSKEIGAIMWSESGGNKRAVSSAGARGAMQVMPFNFPAGTSDAQMFDPRLNLRAGAKLLAAARNRGQDIVQMASWYNAGGKDGIPWTNDAWIAAGRKPEQASRWGYASQPGYIDSVVAAFNSLTKLGSS